MRRELAISIALGALAAGGCANLLGIEELSPGGGGGDAGADGPGTDGQTADARPDGMTGPLKVGFPNAFMGMAELTTNFVWSIDIRVTQQVTVDQLGIIVANANGASAHLGLYTGTDIRPTTLLQQRNFIGLANGVNEIDIPDVELLPGTYWFAVAVDRTMNVRAGVAGDPDVTLQFAGHGFSSVLPSSFPSPTMNVVKAFNVYLVLAP